MPDREPLVSVIVPVYNRAALLPRLIESLKAQTFDRLEMVFVDDGSDDGSLEIMRQHDEIRALHQDNRGPAAARNAGLAVARGEIVHFLDSDTIAPPDLVRVHAEAHRRLPRHIVQGQVVRILDPGDAFEVPMGPRHYARPFFATGNVSVRREFVEAAGGFDEVNFRLGWEDLDLGLRLRRLGVAVKRLYRRGFVWHLETDISREEEFRAFIDRRRTEGRTALDFYRKHPGWRTRMMTMTGRPFLWLDALLFDDERLRSPVFYRRVRSLWRSGRKARAAALLRWAATHFYLRGVRERMAEGGMEEVL